MTQSHLSCYYCLIFYFYFLCFLRTHNRHYYYCYCYFIYPCLLFNHLSFHISDIASQIIFCTRNTNNSSYFNEHDLVVNSVLFTYRIMGWLGIYLIILYAGSRHFPLTLWIHYSIGVCCFCLLVLFSSSSEFCNCNVRSSFYLTCLVLTVFPEFEVSCSSSIQEKNPSHYPSNIIFPQLYLFSHLVIWMQCNLIKLSMSFLFHVFHLFVPLFSILGNYFEPSFSSMNYLIDCI